MKHKNATSFLLCYNLSGSINLSSTQVLVQAQSAAGSRGVYLNVINAES